jgi:copper chaperone NosL
MKGAILSSIVVVFCLSLCGSALCQDDVRDYRLCRQCKMDRGKFAYGRVLIEYLDKTKGPFCSTRCAAVDLIAHLDKTPGRINVGDYNTKNLIDGEKAFWVVGGQKMGIMTRRAKWAFEKREDAEAFIREQGGELVGFDEAMKASFEDIYRDMKMIWERRKMRMEKESKD